MQSNPLSRGWAMVALSAAFALAAVPAVAQTDPHQHHNHQQADHSGHGDHAEHMKSAGKTVAPQTAKVTLTDTPLVDQDGRGRRFKTEAIGERIVVVDFVYTTCTTVCPVLSQVMLQAQGKLGDRLGKDVAMVTVTVDPVRDTPARLKEYATKLGAGPAWTWLTGPKPQVDEVLKSFGAYTANFVEHPPLVLVGDPKSGTWKRFYGFPNPDQIVQAVGELAAARAKGGNAG